MTADVHEYGYSVVGLYAGEGYEFVYVGAVLEADHEWYGKDGLWHKVKPNDSTIGRTIEKDWVPVRRKLSNASKWCCSHGRAPEDRFCVVCAVFLRHITK